MFLGLMRGRIAEAGVIPAFNIFFTSSISEATQALVPSDAGSRTITSFKEIPLSFNRSELCEEIITCLFLGFLERVAKVNEKTRKSWLHKIEQALKLAVPQLTNLEFTTEKGYPSDAGSRTITSFKEIPLSFNRSELCEEIITCLFLGFCNR